MAEDYARHKQYEYRSNSNLVLQPETRSRIPNEPTGEPETLANRPLARMGSSLRATTRDIDEKKKKKSERIKKQEKTSANSSTFTSLKELQSKVRGGGVGEATGRENVLSAAEEFDGTLYRPKTKETKIVYEKLLNFVQGYLGDQPQDILRGAADEVLATLKEDGVKDHEKKKTIEKLLTTLPNEEFAILIAIGKAITDYTDDSQPTAGDTLDDEHGVAVVFDEEDESDMSDYEVKEESDEEGEDTQISGAQYSFDAPESEDGDKGDGEEGLEDEEHGLSVKTKEIGGFWLQKKLSENYSNFDAYQSQKYADSVLKVLENKNLDQIACENNLVALLDYEKFDFIKVLLYNRWKIVYCTRLSRAQSEDERNKIYEEMNESPELSRILRILQKKNTTSAATKSKNIEKSIRKEARLLAQEFPSRNDVNMDANSTNLISGTASSILGSSAISSLSGTVSVIGHQSGIGSTISGRELKDPSAATAKGAASAVAPPRGLIDLEDLTFQQGSHLMTNKQCKLPPGSFRTQKKGYEEVHVPALKAPPMGNESLVKIADLPEWARGAFSGMFALNRIQSRVYEAALFSPDNLLICAPTGAGKTNVAMLTILHEIGLNIDPHTNELNKDAFKIIYIAPMKSLVQEMVGNFSSRLASYGITVRELTGDHNLTKQQISETQIIVTTPEKWDIVTRKSGDRTYTQLVRLMIIDEVHLLHDDRGPVLESLVARTMRQIESTQEMVRLVGLSATLPNFEDVARFLRVKKERLFSFDNSYRPVPLEQHYIGITEKKPLKRFQLMNEITYEKVMEEAGKNQVLIFVHSRKETYKSAKTLRDMCLENDQLGLFLGDSPASREILQAESETTKNPELKELLPYGFAIHHAGMSRSDRTLVEDLFADKHIQVLVSTATLAWGVNLPAHKTIIKGTQIYNPEKGRWVELSALDIMQMLGRAGRPQYDTCGEGVIITSHTELQYYLSVLNQQLPIESHFINRLADCMNAEIVLGTVSNIYEAVDWLRYTYLYICMLRSPTLYGVSYQELEEDPKLEQRRYDLCHTAATLLDKTNLIKYDKKSGTFQVTDLGRVASHYYVTHDSIATYNEHLKSSMSDIELFRLFSLSSEFKFINVREEEKIELEKLLERVPIPVKDSIEEPAAKVNVLLQAFISRLKMEGFALISDMVYITQSAARLMRALFEIVLKRHWAQLAEKALNLCKMIERRMWSSQSPLRQFKTIPEEVIRKLERNEFSFDRLYDLNAQEIGELIHFPAQGKTIHRHIQHFPRLELNANVQPITRSVFRVELSLVPDFHFDEKIHGKAQGFWVWVEDVDSEVILHHEYFILKKKFQEDEHLLTFTVPLYDPLPPQYFIRVVSDTWIGSETVLPISFRHLILPEKYPPDTELLDLQPLPVTVFSKLSAPPSFSSWDDAPQNCDIRKFSKIYGENFEHFNSIQTQSFQSLFHHDDNVLICAPTGSGKTVCAELALLRAFYTNPKARCVYIAPIQAIVSVRLKEWKEKFEKELGRKVVELTGETAADLKLLEKGELIISTPDKWDTLSRRWKQRKNIQNVSLFIIDELHLLGSENGHIMEIITSRMRYISSQPELTNNNSSHKIRMVGLSSSLANGRDVGEWMGCSHNNIFNFHPNVRPIPLEIHMQGFDIPHFAARILSMTKPMLNSIRLHSGHKPVIIYVHNRKQALITCQDLKIYCETFNTTTTKTDKSPFLHCNEEDLEPHLQHVKNKTLQDLLKYGIGFVHEGLSTTETSVVYHLFNSGALQILVSVKDLCWSQDNLHSHQVIILGTQYYNGKEHRYTDYAIGELLQMMGRSSRPTIDESGVCLILCHAPKKEYFKKFLFEPLPIESTLDHYLHDHLNAEVVTRTIENKQDAVDYLTWTFYYRRLSQNPNYYNLQGVSHRHLSDHLSELVENTLSNLEQSKCVSVEEELEVHPLNLGMIASYYYTTYTTIELFSNSLAAKTKLKGLIEILSSASEFDDVPIRQRETTPLKKLAAHLPLKLENPNYHEAHTKTNILLQSHFSRRAITADLLSDQRYILLKTLPLLQAMVDVISSNGWLSPALATMELSQMITQAVWDNDPVLKQLPHFSEKLIERAQQKGIESVFDLIELDNRDREELLQMTPKQLQDVAKCCNAYPSIEVKYHVEGHEDEDLQQGKELRLQAGENCVLIAELERDLDEGENVPKVHAPFYPKEKVEGWWLVLGEPKTNSLLSIKRLALQRTARVRLEFQVPPQVGLHAFQLYFMCDAYTGCDQEFDVVVKVSSSEEQEPSDVQKPDESMQENTNNNAADQQTDAMQES